MRLVNILLVEKCTRWMSNSWQPETKEILNQESGFVVLITTFILTLTSKITLHPPTFPPILKWGLSWPKAGKQKILSPWGRGSLRPKKLKICSEFENNVNYRPEWSKHHRGRTKSVWVCGRGWIWTKVGGDILNNSSYYFKLFLVTYTAPISSSKIMKLNEVLKLIENK